MDKVDSTEAKSVCDLVLSELLAVCPTAGQTGADVRTAVGDFIANGLALIAADAQGPALQNIYTLAFNAGITQPQLASIFDFIGPIATTTLGGSLTKDWLAELTLAFECQVIATMSFVSRDQVDGVMTVLIAQFTPLEEAFADAMDQASYRALLQLRSGIVGYLTQTAQPLPRLVNFEFYQVLPTLVQAYRLYADASRADELRAENNVVHPLFAPRTGVALSQ
jgi:hypothetical protein